jgi:ABC-type sulfate transport system permease subunit
MMNKLLVACALMVVGTAAFAAGIDDSVQNVPEPGTLALVALAVVAGVVARRGKK